ncbi:MAG: glycosyltransferase family 4 protein [Candidatus Electrothrix scaldis]|nr:MAG: glycosyltransferase family 4 protein [Candidatus Electrothrix sp. GW3-3]
MKICYISYVYYGGGFWVHTSQFIKALRKINPELVVHTPLACPDEAEDSEYDSFWERSRIINSLREVRALLAMFCRYALSEFQMLRKARPDVVILRQGRYLSALPLCRLLNIPIILEVNGPALEDQFMPKDERLRCKFFWRWLEHKMMALPDHIMVVSGTLKQYYVNYGLSDERITSVPNGVNLNTFNARITGERTRQRLGIKGKTVIGFSGSFAPWHGVDFLADTFNVLVEQHSDLVLLLIGEPWDILTMPDLPEDMTIITGHIAHDKVPEYLAAIDIFVAPYPEINPFYFSPLKIFEAMAMSRAVIASAQGQICELITDGVSGLLYQAGNQTEFLSSIEHLIINTQLRDQLGQKARKVIENNFTWKDNARRMLKLCRQVIDKKSHE